jgi:hypothetical protein
MLVIIGRYLDNITKRTHDLSCIKSLAAAIVNKEAKVYSYISENISLNPNASSEYVLSSDEYDSLITFLSDQHIDSSSGPVHRSPLTELATGNRYVIGVKICNINDIVVTIRHSIPEYHQEIVLIRNTTRTGGTMP